MWTRELGTCDPQCDDDDDDDDDDDECEGVCWGPHTVELEHVMGKREKLDMQSCGRTDGLFVSVMCADPGSYAIHTCNVDGGAVATFYSEDDDTCSGESIRTAVVGASGVCYPDEGGYIMVSCDGEAASYGSYADPSCEGPPTWTHPLGRCDPQCDDKDDDDDDDDTDDDDDVNDNQSHIDILFVKRCGIRRI